MSSFAFASAPCARTFSASRVQRGEIQPHERVVVVSTAHGLKFTGFKTGYHEGRLDEVESEHANPPVYLTADPRVVKETIARKLEL